MFLLEVLNIFSTHPSGANQHVSQTGFSIHTTRALKTSQAMGLLQNTQNSDYVVT
jgi:hypothetical protein